jgi:hypothetical protein
MRVFKVFGVSFSGSSALNLVMGSHSEIHGGGELHKIFRPDKSPRCSICQYECGFWKPNVLSKLTPATLYAQVGEIFEKKFVVDSSKIPDHFESVEVQTVRAESTYILLSKHPLRHIASYVNNKHWLTAGLVKKGRLLDVSPMDRNEMMDFARRKSVSLLRQYKAIRSSLYRLSGGNYHEVKYESFVSNPKLTLQPILEEGNLHYQNGMESFESFEHHPIGGNRGPHLQINQSLSSSRFFDLRKNFYEKARGLTLDNKFQETFSEHEIENLTALSGYQDLCEDLGFSLNPL